MTAAASQPPEDPGPALRTNLGLLPPMWANSVRAA